MCVSVGVGARVSVHLCKCACMYGEEKYHVCLIDRETR